LENLKHTGYYYGALLFAFLIPFHPKLSTLALVLWLLLSLISFSQKTLVRNKTLLLLPIAYVAYFICFFTAETPKFRFLETKLSLLVFPLIFFLNVYSVRQRGKILKFLVFGLVVSSILCFIVAFYNSIGIENGNLYFRANVLEGKGFMDSILYGGNYFFGRYLSIFHQTVYYAMYLCAGVAVLLFVPKLFTTKLRTSLLGIFLFFIFLVSNKASFIALALILILKLHTWNVNRSKKAIGVSLFQNTF
jgi:O-antigen ligase